MSVYKEQKNTFAILYLQTYFLFPQYLPLSGTVRSRKAKKFLITYHLSMQGTGPFFFRAKMLYF